MSAFAKQARIAWQVMMASYVGLLLLLLVTTFANPPASIDSTLALAGAGIAIWLLKVAPLLLLLRGLLKRSHKTASWLSFMIMLYFVLAVMLTFTPGANGQGWLMVILTGSAFMSSMLYTRWQKRAEAGL